MNPVAGESLQRSSRSEQAKEERLEPVPLKLSISCWMACITGSGRGAGPGEKFARGLLGSAARIAPMRLGWFISQSRCPGSSYFGDGRLVDVHIRRLRTKIEADPANPKHVVTVRGLGYKLQA